MKSSMHNPHLAPEKYGIMDGISECIVTTISSKGPNAAPMGIIKNSNGIKIRVFKGSKTYGNIMNFPFLAANVVYDPKIYTMTTFSNLERSQFDTIVYEDVEFPVLKDGISWMLFECNNLQKSSQSLVADLIPVKAKLSHIDAVRAPNRGFNSVLEACIHATRYQLTGSQKYLDLMQYHAEIIRKCGGKTEKKHLTSYTDL